MSDKYDVEKLGAKIQDVERRGRIRDLVGELGLDDAKQGEAVLGLMEKNADLDSHEALELAAKRNPEAFKVQANSGFDKNVHGSLRPTPGNQPPGQKPSEHKQRMDYARKLIAAGRRHDADDVVVDLIGKAGADALGWSYPLRPIPPQW